MGIGQIPAPRMVLPGVSPAAPVEPPRFQFDRVPDTEEDPPPSKILEYIIDFMGQ